MSAVGFVPSPKILAAKQPLVRDGRVYIEGEIGSEPDMISSLDVRMALSDVSDRSEIEVVVHSSGGGGREMFKIYDLFRESRIPIRARIQEAYSSASVIALAGSEVEIEEHGLLMIHDPLIRMEKRYPNATDLQKYVDELSDLKQRMLNVYERRTGMPREDLARLMTAEAQFRGQEAVDAGFADRVVPDTIPRPCPHCGQPLPSKLHASN